MQIAKLPSDEELRLQDLFSYDILDSETEKEFNELVELAGQICDCPISMITFVDKDRQWFKARLDQGPKETSRDVAFCAHVILQEDLMVVEDALKDERFDRNPLVTESEQSVRFYAGAPIVSPTGYNVGTICVINTEPKTLTAKQERALQILSNQVTRLLELRSKNKQIRNRAEEIMELKDQSANRALTDNESQRHNIAEELHEQIAQQAAACKLYLRMAEEGEEIRVPYIKQANTYLEAIVNDLRKLSNKISPSILYSVPFEGFVTDYVKKVEQELPFAVSVNINGTKSSVSVDKTITLFRIVEKWLSVLQNREGVNNVVINLSLSNKIKLTFEDDGKPLDFHKIENDLIAVQIDTRVDSIGGVIKTKTGKSNGNILSIEVPV